MKMVKSLILGSAAGLVAMSGAQAADLPVKAKPVEYVRICSCMVPVSSIFRARHLHQAGWLSARRHYVQWQHLRSAGLVWRSGQHNRYATISQPARVWR